MPRAAPRAPALALAVVGSVLVSTVLLAAAISVYPGGSERHPDARGFDARNNYVCDLLREVAPGGVENPASPLARAALALFVAGLIPFFLLVAALLADRPARARLVRVAGVASALGWIAMALTPSDRSATGHALFILTGIVPGVVAAAVAVLELARRPGRRALALLGACTLACVAADGALYFLLLATLDPTLTLVVPLLQKLAGAFLIAWLLGVAAAATRDPQVAGDAASSSAGARRERRGRCSSMPLEVGPMRELDDADRIRAMHDAHRTWASDHEAWREDVQTWSTQHAEALADLEGVEDALRELHRAVEDHGERLRTHEQALQEHEHELAELEARCAREQVAPRTLDHEDLGAQHEREREAHARLKATQHEVLALVRKLRRVTTPSRR